MKIKSVILLCLMASIAGLNGWNFFSPIYKIERFYIDENNKEQLLSYKNIIEKSEMVYNDSLIFQINSDYQIDYSLGKIIFYKPVYDIFISYEVYPENLIKDYFLYEELDFTDSLKIEKLKRKRQIFRTDSQLNINGNKTISISVANNDDFSLDQSLFLRINGSLAKNLYIEAQLSDSQSPITPEGDSRELSSLDQIYLKVFNKDYELALGDLELQYKSTDFFNFTPKFEGLKVSKFGRNNVQAAIAIAKGKRGEYEFPGIEGKQGPYYITVDNTTGVQIVPGSEQIYLDGVEVFRGNDYTIDYSEGSITFTNSNFISSNSAVRAVFQYTDEQYRQYMYLASSTCHITDNLTFIPQIIWQEDDRENPLLDDYTDDDIDVLKTAGDSIAWSSGIYFREDGSGAYNLDEDGEFYYYVGNDTAAVGYYDVIFSYVGAGNGFYEKAETGDYFVYVGQGGSYLTGKRLLPPQRLGNAGFLIKFQQDIISLDAETIITDQDKNLWSSKDDKDNSSLGLMVALNMHPDWDKIKPQLSLKHRYWQDNLNLFSDLNSPLEIYELEQTPDTLETHETTIKSSCTLYDKFKPTVTIRLNDVDSYMSQQYLSFSSDIINYDLLPIFNYRYLDQQQDYSGSDIYDNTSYHKHQLNMKIKPGNPFLQIKYINDQYEEEWLTAGNYGLKKDNLEARIGLENNNDRIELFWKQEQSDTLNVNNNWNSKDKVKTYGASSQYSSKNFNINLMAAHRIVENDEKQEYDLAEIDFIKSFFSNSLRLSGNYELSNIEFYPKIRELEYVGEELGIYDSLGFVSEDGEYDYVLTAIDYDNPEMSIEVNSSTHLSVDPGRNTEKFWKNIRSETYLQITENSIATDKKKIYLLNPNYIKNKENTLYGRYFLSQNFRITLIPGLLKSRLQFEDEEIMDQRYNDTLETRERRNYIAQIQIISLLNSNWELEYEHASESETRYQLNSIEKSLSLSCQNKINNDITLKTSVGYSNEDGDELGDENNFQLTSLIADQLLTYFGKNGLKLTAQIKYRHNKRSGYDYTSFADREHGNIYKWSLILNYRMNNYTYLTMEYGGDKYPLKDQVHEFRMEIKAEL